MRILVVAAHPDDELLGAGATIAKHIANGDNVTVLIMADCLSARDRDRIDRREPLAVPASSMGAAMEMGYALRFAGFGGMTLLHSLRDIDRNLPVEAAVQSLSPDVVYTHHLGDINSDHRATAEAVMVATRPTGPNTPLRVLAFETPSSTEWAWDNSFRPNVFVDVSTTLPAKLDALQHHYGDEMREPPHPRGASQLTTRAAYWGQVAGLSHAEPFVLLREIVR